MSDLYRKSYGWIEREEYDGEVSLDVPTHVTCAGVRYTVYEVDEDTLERFGTLEQSDLGRHYYLVNGAFMFID